MLRHRVCTVASIGLVCYCHGLLKCEKITPYKRTTTKKKAENRQITASKILHIFLSEKKSIQFASSPLDVTKYHPLNLPHGLNSTNTTALRSVFLTKVKRHRSLTENMQRQTPVVSVEQTSGGIC